MIWRQLQATGRLCHGSLWYRIIPCTALPTGKHQDGQEDTEEDSWTQDCWSYGGKIQQVRDDLEPLYAEHGVDLYLAGHEHNYESMYPVLNSTVASQTFIEPTAP